MGAIARHKATVERIRALTPYRIPAKPLPRPRQPSGIILSYFQDLERILDYAQGLVKLRILPRIADWVYRSQVHKDAVEDDGSTQEVFDSLEDDFLDQFNILQFRAIADRIGNATSQAHRRELSRQLLAGIGIDLPRAEPWLAAKIADFVVANVAYIKSIPDTYFSDVRKIVTSGVLSGQRPDAIKSDLVDRFGIAEDRARLIARDQTTKFFGELNKVRQQDVGISQFTWRTMEDERVRPSHDNVDGNVYYWNDPPMLDGEPATPGSPVNCRCWAEPIFTDIYEGLNDLDYGTAKVA